MLIQYCNLVHFHSCKEDYLEMVDLIEEKGYSPSEEAGHDITTEFNRLQEGKFDKHRQFKITFDTETKTYFYEGKTLEIKEFFNDVASQETIRSIDILKTDL